MRTIRLIGLAAFALCAFAAIAASASASLPEILSNNTGCDLSASRPARSVGPYPGEVQCLNSAGQGSGDWWFLGGAFTSTSTTDHLVAGSNKINCTKDSDEGLIGGKKSVGELLITFSGCKLELFGIECKSKGAKPEEIMTVKLRGTFGYINKSTKLVGIKLEPESGTEFTQGEVECVGTKVKVTGSLIGVVSPVNTKSTSGTIELTASGSKQAHELIEIGEKDETGVKLKASLNGEPAMEASEETTDTLTFEEAVELMA